MCLGGVTIWLITYYCSLYAYFDSRQRRTPKDLPIPVPASIVSAAEVARMKKTVDEIEAALDESA